MAQDRQAQFQEQAEKPEVILNVFKSETVEGASATELALPEEEVELRRGARHSVS